MNPAWRQLAACKGMDSRDFFPVAGETVPGIAICQTCPVTVECLAAGRGEYGVWGGLGESARRRLGEPLQVKPGPGNMPAQCGTESGYTAHRRLRTPTCDGCRQAHSLGNARRQAKIRAERRRAA